MSGTILSLYLEIAISFAFSVEVVNLYLLVKLKKWADNTGKHLIDDVIKSLNLKWGKDSPVREQIKDVVEHLSPQIAEAVQAVKGTSQGLDPQSIIQGLIEGNIDWRTLIPIAVKALSSPSSEQISEGAWH